MKVIRKRGIRGTGLVRNTIVIFATSLVASLLLYLFHLSMGKMLGPERFAAFEVLASIFMMALVSTNVVGLVIIRYISYFSVKSQFDKIAELSQNTLKMLIVAGFFIFLLLSLFSRPIASILKIYKPGTIEPMMSPIIILGLTLWAFLMVIGLQSILNGLQRFGMLGLSRIVESAATLIIGLVLVVAGLEINGAMIALLLGAIASIFFTSLPVKNIFMIKPSRLGKLGIKNYLLISAIASMSMAVMLNTDVIIVKVLFDELQAGYFAAASIIGGVVFFVSMSVNSVTFPKAVERHSQGKESPYTLKFGLLVTGIVSMILVIAYHLFPEHISELLFGHEYKISNLIGLFVIGKTFLALTNIILIYDIAMKKARLLPVAAGGVIVQILLLAMFHESLRQVIAVMAAFNALLLAITVFIAREDLKGIFKQKPQGYFYTPLKLPEPVEIK